MAYQSFVIYPIAINVEVRASKGQERGFIPDSERSFNALMADDSTIARRYTPVVLFCRFGRRDCEQSLPKVDERLAQNKEAAEQLSKEKAELDTRFTRVNKVLSRLRSQPMVELAVESAATLAADQAIKMKDGVLAALARFQSELSS
ncbi:hypothetical protein ACLOJK_014894 [Asimina triloba]